MGTASARTTLAWSIAGAMLLILVVVATALARRAPVEYPPGTPEATVQGFTQAIIDRRFDIAADLIHDENDDVKPMNADWCHRDLIRVTLVDVEYSSHDGEEWAYVDVNLTYRNRNAPFELDETTRSRRLELIQIDGEWLVDELPGRELICQGG